MKGIGGKKKAPVLKRCTGAAVRWPLAEMHGRAYAAVEWTTMVNRESASALAQHSIKPRTVALAFMLLRQRTMRSGYET